MRSTLDAVAAGKAVPPRLIASLWQHVDACADCQRAYDRAVRTTRVVNSAGQSADEVGRWELDIVEQRVLAGLAPPRRRQRAWLTGFSLAFAAAAALAVALVVITRPHSELRPPEWQTRAAATDTFAVRAFCEVQGPQGEPHRVSLSATPAPGESSTCARNGRLRFAYVSQRSGLLYVEAHTDDGEPLRLAADAPIRLEPAARLSPLPLVIDAAAALRARAIIVTFVLAGDPDREGTASDAAEADAEPGIRVVRHVLSLGEELR